MFKIFKSNMDSELYREILGEYLMPFVALKYGFDVRLHQDNDPKHRSELCTSFLEENDIEWVFTLSAFELKY